MTFYNEYTQRYESDPSLTPFGVAHTWVLLFERYPIYRMFGPPSPVDHRPQWIAYMCRSEFAYTELEPVTLRYANNGGGVFHDDESRGWFCFNADGVEAAYLAWDFAPFLEYENWTPGIAAVYEAQDPDWIDTRRTWCRDMINRYKSQFLSDFYAQFKHASQDQPL